MLHSLLYPFFRAESVGVILEVQSTAQAELLFEALVAVHLFDDLRHGVVDRQSLEEVQVLLGAQLSLLDGSSRHAQSMQRIKELLLNKV